MAAAGRVERALAHQAVHAGFGAQQAVGVLAFDLDRGAFDAGHVAGGFFFDRGLEALALGVLEVRAQQHAGPVAGLGAAGAGLNVDKAVERVGLHAEHAAELQLFDLGLELGGFGLDGHQAIVIAFFLAHLEQFGVVGQFLRETIKREHHAIERFLFLAQFLRLLGVVPDGRIFERGVYRAQAFKFGIEVKDTSVTLAFAPPGQRGCCR